MLKKKGLLQYGVFRMPLYCLLAVGCGYLLSIGTVCGAASPLAAAAAGICPPLYGFCILLGALFAFVSKGLAAEMYFLLSAIVCIVCMRILFYEAHRPHALAILAAFAGVVGGAAADFLFRTNQGMFPAYVMEAMLIGIAVYFLTDAGESIRKHGKVKLDAGKSFTFAIAFLLCITALSGLNLPFCNAGRTASLVVTLLAARQYRQTGGTLCGALSSCGVVLCSVKLGMPLLFLPVTGMMAGFLSAIPNALFIPVFFVIQLLSAAVFDSSTEFARVLVELLFSCVLYGLCCHSDFCRLVALPLSSARNSSCDARRARYLASTLEDLREETAAVMQRLKPPAPADPVTEARNTLCTGCKNENYCWTHRAESMESAFQELLHHPGANPGPEALGGCIRRGKLTECLMECSSRAALAQTERVQLTHSRAVMLEILQLLEELTTAGAAEEHPCFCQEETAALREILRQCGLQAAECFVCRLKSGRFTAEVYSRETEFPSSAVREMLGEMLSVIMCSLPPRETGGGIRVCFYQQPPYSLECTVKSVNAPDYARCGDTADCFTDGTGNQYLLLSDGMGSGSSASLASRLAVRTFTRLVEGGMPEGSVIRLLNTLLLSETNTENFATFDVLKLHADSGELELFKSGASSTIIQHHRQVIRIASPSFPIGIVAHSEPFRKKMTAYPGDRIVMLSDGIHEAEYPYIKELLLQGSSLEELAEAICSKASAFCGGSACDDMTVIAAAVGTSSAQSLTAPSNKKTAIYSGEVVVN